MARVSTTDGGYGGGAFVIHTDSSHSEYVSVPDADLLFRGDYHRAGPDLVLTGHDGRHHIVPGYFASEKHAALVAPNGASLSADVVDLLAGSPAPGQYAQAQPTTPPDSIGKVEKIVGDVTVVRNGVSVALHVGDAVFKSDVIVTGGDSSAGITFPDGTVLDLVANSRMALNEYSFEPNGANNGAVFTLVEGTFGFVAGQVAHDNHMSVVTPVATMGIRGTAGIVRHEFRANAGDLLYSFLVLDEIDIRRHGHHVGAYEVRDNRPDSPTFGEILQYIADSGYVTSVEAQGSGLPPIVTTEPITNSRLFTDRPILQDLVDSYGQFNGPGGIHSPGSGDSPNQLFGPQFLPENGGGNPINFIGFTPTGGTNNSAATTSFTTPLLPPETVQPVIAVTTPTQTLVINTAGAITGVSVSETNSTSGETFTVTLTDNNGALSVNTSATGGGGTITSSNSGHTLTIVGTLSQVNADLTTLTDNDTTPGTDNITVTATDSLGHSASPQTINVTVNAPPPTAVASAITATEDTAYTFKVADFHFSDAVTPDTLGSVTITSLPTDGTLIDNGHVITATDAANGYVVSVADITSGKFTFVPTTDTTTTGSFNFQVTDQAGQTLSANTAAMTVTITADAGPTAVASAVTATEDTAYAFKVADFKFTDSADTTPDTLGSVTITSLPTDGTLIDNGHVITATDAANGYVVSVADITSGKFTFVPTTDTTTTGSFNFQVTDQAGQTLSANTAAMTVTITADAGPTAVASAVTATEDTAYAFKVADFKFTDSADTTPDTLGSVTITSLPTDGTLIDNGHVITATDAANGYVVSVADITSGKFTFVPTTDTTTTGSFNFQVTDQAGQTLSANTAAMTVTITADAGPTAVASAVTATEDTAYAFKVADFKFTDSADTTPDTLGSVTITSLPTDGTLIDNGHVITATDAANGYVVSVADITSGKFTFVPTTDTTTTGSFNFQVTDQAGQTLSANTAAMTVTITADAGPTAVASAVTATEDTAYAFKVADFKFTDSADTTPDTLGSVTITSLPTDGTLIDNGHVITATDAANGYVVSVADITSGKFTFVPTTDTTTTGSFNFQVTDQAGQTLSANTAAMTVTITADAGPTAVASAVTATEDTAYAFKVADFKFTDSADTTPDTLGSVTITSLPTDGTLIDNGHVITATDAANGYVVSVADITSGKFTFVPTTDTTTTGSFNFQVTDQAGQTLSANTAAMTVTITADAGPTAVASAVTATEDTAYAFKVADFKFTDSADTTPDTLGSVTITSLPTDGTLIDNGHVITATDAANGYVVSVADITSGKFTFVPTTDTTTTGSFNFQVTDQAGQTLSANTAAMTVTITADAGPTAVASAVTATEDTAYAFKVADFKFTDSADTTPDTLGSVTITSLPTDGTLIDNGHVITATDAANGYVVSVADITSGKFTFVPTTDTTTTGSFNFQVTDQAGQTLSANTAAMTVTITADAGPTAVASAVTATEDTAYAFKVADFKFTDSADTTPDTLGSVTITSLPTDGTLIDNGHVITATDAANGYVVSVADITSGKFTFVPTTDTTTTGSFNFQVTDQAGQTLSANTAAMTVTITADAGPTAVASAVTATEDTAYAFKVADFKFTDSADTTPDTLGSVTITSLPTDGTLIDNGHVITATDAANGYVVSVADITSGKFTFVPTTDTTTTGSFNFQVTDQAGQTLSANTAAMTVTITADAGPTAVASAVTATEDTAYAFKVADFKFTDSADTTPDTLGSVTITSLPTDGTLIDNGHVITATDAANGYVVSVADITSGKFTFVPTTDTTTTGSFNFQVTDQAGQTLSANTAAMTVTITADAGPTAVASAVTATEDTAYAFKVADFKFTDSADTTPDTLGSVTITSLPTDGTLIDNGHVITATDAANGYVVSVADITSGKFTFVPTTDTTTTGSFNFQVTDQAGQTLSANTAAMTVTITADAGPTAVASAVTATEDTAYAFKVADFKFTDSADTTPDTLGSVTITSLPTDGTLIDNGHVITATDAANGYVVSVADITSGKFTFVPTTDTTTTGSFNFQVTDQAGQTLSANTAAMTVTITADAGPTAVASAVTATEDTAYAFKVADFKFTDSADTTPDTLGSVTITSLPTDGTLIDNGHVITATDAANGYVVSVADITSGKFTFVPTTDTTTTGSFNFQVTDQAGQTLSANTAAMTVTITADAGPTAVASAVTATEDTAYAFKVADFKFTDSADTTPDTLGSVTITSLPTDGTLIDNGHVITATDAANGYVVSVADITSGKFTFVPTTDTTTTGSFNFQVTDQAGQTLSANTAAMTVTITADAGPTAVASAVTATEDTAYAFKVADFKFTDSADTTPDTLGSVTITSLPTDGTLIDNGHVITATDAANGYVVSVADITSGKFTFVPTTDTTTTGSFNFQVTDQAGQTLSANTAAMTVTITADAGPTAVASAVTATEDTAYAFKVADFKFTDSADTTPDTLGSVTITSLPTDGTLIFFNGATEVAVTTGQVITAAEIAAGDLTLVPNTDTTTTGSFQFKVTDSEGGTLSANAATMTVNLAQLTVAFTSESENEASETWTLKGTDSNTGGSGVQSVKVYLGSISTTNYLGTATLSNGTWTLTTPHNVPDSSHLTFVAVVTDNAGNTNTASVTVADPAGVAGNPINLALTDPSGGQATGPITLTFTGVPSDWSLNQGTNLGNGTWAVQTNDLSALTVLTAATYTGAMVLGVTETWTNANGSIGTATVADNVEAYAPGTPIFALSGNDTLTGAGGNNEYVFAQPIGNDTIYNFNAATDKIDLIGFANIAGFNDIKGNIADDGHGDTVITIGAGETITLQGVSAASLTAADFVFNQTPVVENAGNMVVSDGAVLPLSGTIDNTGTIALNSTGDQTELQIVGDGVTLQGGGQVTLSGAAVIIGTGSAAVLTNVDNTISGAGQIGSGDGTLTLINETHGTIDANVAAGTFTLETGTTITNNGVLEALNGGTLQILDPVTGSGSAIIEGGTMIFGAQSNMNVAFENGVGTPTYGELVLGDAAGFSGQISGFVGTAPDTAHSDAIDLEGINYNSSSFSETYDAAKGLLTVTDGSHSASLTFDNFGGTLSFASDGNGGTLITDPPATRSSSPSPSVSVAGPGNDSFVFHPGIGADTVANFNPQNDTIELDHFANIQNVQQLAALIGTDAHGDAVIELGHNDSITLPGVTQSYLQAHLQSLVHLG